MALVKKYTFTCKILYLSTNKFRTSKARIIDI